MPDRVVQPDGSVIDPTRHQVAQQADQTSQAIASGNRAVGLISYHYGDSLSVDPPTAGVHGKSWMNLLQRELKLDKFVTYAVGGSDALGIAWHVVNGSIGASGLPQPPGGAKWDGTRRGIVTLSTLVNDAAATFDRTAANIDSPIGPDAISGFTGAFRAILAILSSASRVEVENATLTGTWTVNNSSQFSNGTSRYTTTPNDHVDFAGVTFPASGKVYVIFHSVDPAAYGSPPNVTEIKVDGVVVKTVTPDVLTLRPQKTGASTTMNFAPCAVEVDASPGNHAITITHKGTSGQMLSLDFIAIPAATPPPIIHLNEYDPPLPVGTPTRLANLAVLRPLYKAVCDEFSNVKQVAIVMDTPGFSTADELHPNERGAIEIEVEIAAGIRDFLTVYNPDNLYTGLGAVTTPQFGQNLSPVTAWTVASGANLRFTSRQMVCISGGTVTAINIDGVATGLTSGSFIVKPGHAISITYSVVPNASTWDIS